MKNIFRILTVTCIAGALASRGADAGPAADKKWWSSLIPESIGTRSTYNQFIDYSRGPNDHYLGSIAYLRDRRDLTPDRVFADWALCKYCFVEVTWDAVKADATGHHYNSAGQYVLDDVDGVINMSGPILTLVGRYPNSTVVTPYAGVGIAIWNAVFDHHYWHRLGYQSVASWEADGSPSPTADNPGFRHIFIDDNNGFVATVGLDVRLAPHWSLDFYGRYIDINTRYHYQLVRGDGSMYRNVTGEFPMSNYVGGLGVRYSF